MNLLVLGANSEIGQETARQFALNEKANLILASRDQEELEKQVRDLSLRYGVEAKALFFDALDYDSHGPFYLGLDPKPDGVVVAFGLLGNQGTAQGDFREARKIIETNYLGAVSILEIVAADFESRRHGFIIALGSVAGLRGRQSNYLYGSAKAGLGIYLGGLRNRLYRSGVRVITVLPGFVRTKMTENLDFPHLLVSEPAMVAKDIYQAYKQGKDVIYSKWLWKWIMLLIRFMPEAVFKRLKL